MKEDLRVKKTKRALTLAFIELLKVKHFEDITINELCEKAEIRRATFYSTTPTNSTSSPASQERSAIISIHSSGALTDTKLPLSITLST